MQKHSAERVTERDWGIEGERAMRRSVKLIQSESKGPAAGVTLKNSFSFLSFLCKFALPSPSLPASSRASRYFSAFLSFLIRGAILLHRGP